MTDKDYKFVTGSLENITMQLVHNRPNPFMPKYPDYWGDDCVDSDLMDEVHWSTWALRNSVRTTTNQPQPGLHEKEDQQ